MKAFAIAAALIFVTVPHSIAAGTRRVRTIRRPKADGVGWRTMRIPRRSVYVSGTDTNNVLVSDYGQTAPGRPPPYRRKRLFHESTMPTADGLAVAGKGTQKDRFVPGSQTNTVIRLSRRTARSNRFVHGRDAIHARHRGKAGRHAVAGISPPAASSTAIAE